MKVLVTGGAGYIGSFMVKRLLDRGDEVVVADNLKRGHKSAVDKRAELLVGDLLDKDFIKTIFNKKYDGVIHFAGYISMGESVENPYIYFQNNVFGSLNLIEGCVKNLVTNFIFSSTAGVYGNPIETPIPEDHPKNPENPYGESKMMVERVLKWYRKRFDLSWAALRYFNAAGAALDGSMGEQHDPETHIIPNIMKAAIEKKPFTLFGTDYNTPDGTCIRDYIHVLDLVESHVMVLDRLVESGGVHVYNIGTGKGHSNKEVIDTVKEVTGINFKVEEAPRRPGDATILVANPEKIKNEIGFSPKHSNLKTIIESAWRWHKENDKRQK